MVGGGSRREDGSLGISSNNVFAALDSLRKKKKSDSSKSKASSTSQQPKEAEPQVFWAPTPLTTKSWADVDDEDDDDYFATTAPLQPVWGTSEEQNKETSATVEEDTESEDDGLDEIDDDVEEEPEHEPEVQQVPVEPVRKPFAAPLVQKDTERQLSKKELKKKELAELDAVLAELGISPKDNSGGQNETHGAMEESKPETNGDAGNETASAPTESKASKKKKKKEKPSAAKAVDEQVNASEDVNGADEVSAEPVEEDNSAVDVKEKLKKMAPTKKKKSSKEIDSSAKAAAAEAAARSARLAAAKKKEKNHYNQQPVR